MCPSGKPCADGTLQRMPWTPRKVLTLKIKKCKHVTLQGEANRTREFFAPRGKFVVMEKQNRVIIHEQFISSTKQVAITGMANRVPHRPPRADQTGEA